MKLDKFIELVIELNKWKSLKEYITEECIGEILSEEDNKYLIIDGVPALSQTALLYLEDGIFYIKLTEIKQIEDTYLNAGHINSISVFDKDAYIELKRE